MDFITIPKNQYSSNTHQEQRYINSLNEEGRTIAVAQCLIPYGDGCIGTNITSKGTSLSGRLFPESIGYLHKRQKEVPWGFFGNTDAVRDTDKSNLLLDASFRGSLGLGYVVLDHQPLKTFIKDKWLSYGTYMVDYLLNSIDIVEKNGDLVTQYIRLGGPRSRITVYDTPSHIVRSQTDGAIHTQLYTGLQLLAWQATHLPASFKQYVSATDLNLRDIPDILEHVAKGSKDSAIPFITLIAGIFSHQGNIMKRMYATQEIFKDAYSGLGLYAKDVDTSLISYDFEGENPYQSHHDFKLKYVSKRVAELGREYFMLLQACGYIQFTKQDKNYFYDLVNTLVA